MNAAEKAGHKIGDRFKVIDGNAANGFSAGSIVELYKDREYGSPLFKLISGSSEYDNADGKPGAYCGLGCLRKILPTTTLRPGDYINAEGISDADYHAVARAFMAAGAARDEYRIGCGMMRSCILFGWESASNGLAHWNDPYIFGDSRRLLTIAQVLGTAAVEWDGTGLPPVGEEVEYLWSNGSVKAGTVLCHVKLAGGAAMALIQYPEGGYDFSSNPLKFRPISTEQRLLTERLQQDASLLPEQAERVIAAGYRKQVEK